MTWRNRPGKWNCEKVDCYPQFREIANSRIEINPEDDSQREGDQLIEMESVAHFESASISIDERLPKKEESIIRPKRGDEAGSLGKKWICAGNTLL